VIRLYFKPPFSSYDFTQSWRDGGIPRFFFLSFLESEEDGRKVFNGGDFP